MIGRQFKTIVFFGQDFPQYEYIKESFAHYPVVKTFQTSNADELDQILHQSNLTAILINNSFYVALLAEINMLGLKEAGVRTYYLDESGALSKEEIGAMSVKRISTLAWISKSELKAKLEMFLLGKLQIQKYKDKDPNRPTIPAKEEKSPRSTYFSHFKLKDDKWSVIVSTHEQEREIEMLFNKSWTIYCMELLNRAKDISEVENDPNFSELYHGIVFPHTDSAGGKALSIVHIRKDDKDFNSILDRALEFLSKI